MSYRAPQRKSLTLEHIRESASTLGIRGVRKGSRAEAALDYGKALLDPFAQAVNREIGGVLLRGQGIEAEGRLPSISWTVVEEFRAVGTLAAMTRVASGLPRNEGLNTSSINCSTPAEHPSLGSIESRIVPWGFSLSFWDQDRKPSGPNPRIVVAPRESL